VNSVGVGWLTIPVAIVTLVVVSVGVLWVCVAASNFYDRSPRRACGTFATVAALLVLGFIYCVLHYGFPMY